ncbi:MAG TPA: porin [Leadbetterella sp.]|nr:porin [Leadbetterella sp.]
MKYSISILLILVALHAIAQENSNKRLTFSGYGELYYSSDFSKVVDEEKPSFIYNHKKLGAIQMNLAFLKASYSNKTFRGNVALMAGNYPRYNLSNEPSWARIIYEANAGIKIVKNRNIWLDAGIMPSHIGFESALGADCWTLTRSLLAENSPYYETGFKLSSASKNEKWNASILALNGWQKIKRPDGIRKPSFGAQINYRPNEKVFVNYSNFVGSDKPDSLGISRVFHNFYTQLQVRKNLDLLIGFDIGTEFGLNGTKKAHWYSPVIISKLRLNNDNQLALRLEYYADANEIIEQTESKLGFKTSGISLNYDHKLSENMLWRIEPKLLYADKKIFTNDKQSSKTDFTITTALTLKL